MTATTCKSKNPASCRYHGATTPAEIEHLEKETLFSTGFVVAQDGDLFSSQPNERTSFLQKRSFMLGTENGWEISPEGSTGANCKCGAYLTRTQTKELCYHSVTCNVCQQRFNNFADLNATNISHESKHFTEEAEVFKASWFHITTDPEWASNVSESSDLPVIHVGSEKAAQDRLTMLSDDIRYGDKAYLFEVRLKPETDIIPEIHGDGNDFQPKTAGERHNSERGKISRYVNSWEDAGSISLLIEGNMFSVVSCTEIDPHE